MQTTPYLDVSLSKCDHLGEEFLYMKILQLKPLVGPLQTEEGGYVPVNRENLSSENNLADISTECSNRHQGESYFPKLKLVTDNLLSIYVAAN